MSYFLTAVAWVLFGLVLPAFYLRSSIGRSVTFKVNKGTGAHGTIRRSLKAKHGLASSPHPNVTTLFELLRHAANSVAPSQKLFGTRSIIRTVEEEKEVTKVINGEKITSIKKWTFFELGPYSWMTYRDVVEAVDALGAGLRKIGLSTQDKVTLFASTSRDWMLMAHACFSQNMIITTAYDTLGEEGLSFSLNEGEVTTLFTQANLIKMIPGISAQVPTLKNVIYAGAVSPDELDAIKQKASNITFYSIQELQDLGAQNPVPTVAPQPEDLCCIMYTSGSTGNPKGVMLTHANVVAAVAGDRAAVEAIITGENCYLAFLPLAHILEFVIENICIYSGVRIGYGSPRTLTDVSVRNCKGDIRELCPTIMAGVPAVWEGIRKAVVAKLAKASPVQRFAFNAAYKLKKLLIELGLSGEFLNNTVFAPIRSQVGGRLKLAISGGAPVAPDTQEFFTVTVAQLIQGYAMTETCGALTIQTTNDAGICGVVGAPATSNEVKLVAVADTDYHPNMPGKPSRGEVWTRGPTVMKGYYKQDKITAETFSEDGWLMTGDIGEWKADGSLAIIDRKKNLVKLANGEYVALERLESRYKMSSFIANLCLHADPRRDYIVALIVPAEKELRALASQYGHDDGVELHDICADSKVVSAVLKDLQKVAKDLGLKPAEIVKAVTLVSEEWTPENGMLTAAQKIKRRDIVNTYDKEIQIMYGVYRAKEE